MLYESRVYTAVPGKLPALNDRFSNHTLGYFNQYGIGMMGFWTDEIGASNQLTYVLTFDDMADREKKWSAFQATRPGCRSLPRPKSTGRWWPRSTTRSCRPRPTPRSRSCPSNVAGDAGLRRHAWQAACPPQPVLQPHHAAVREARHRKRSLLDPRSWAPATGWCTCWAIPAWATGNRDGPRSRRTQIGSRLAPSRKRTGP